MEAMTDADRVAAAAAAGYDGMRMMAAATETDRAVSRVLTATARGYLLATGAGAMRTPGSELITLAGDPAPIVATVGASAAAFILRDAAARLLAAADGWEARTVDPSDHEPTATR